MSIGIDAESVYPKITVWVLTQQGTKGREEIASHWNRNVIELIESVPMLPPHV